MSKIGVFYSHTGEKYFLYGTDENNIHAIIPDGDICTSFNVVLGYTKNILGAKTWEDLYLSYNCIDNKAVEKAYYSLMKKVVFGSLVRVVQYGGYVAIIDSEDTDDPCIFHIGNAYKIADKNLAYVFDDLKSVLGEHWDKVPLSRLDERFFKPNFVTDFLCYHSKRPDVFNDIMYNMIISGWGHPYIYLQRNAFEESLTNKQRLIMNELVLDAHVIDLMKKDTPDIADSEKFSAFFRRLSHIESQYNKDRKALLDTFSDVDYREWIKKVDVQSALHMTFVAFDGESELYKSLEQISVLHSISSGKYDLYYDDEFDSNLPDLNIALPELQKSKGGFTAKLKGLIRSRNK